MSEARVRAQAGRPRHANAVPTTVVVLMLRKQRGLAFAPDVLSFSDERATFSISGTIWREFFARKKAGRVSAPSVHFGHFFFFLSIIDSFSSLSLSKTKLTAIKKVPVCPEKFPSPRRPPPPPGGDRCAKFLSCGPLAKLINRNQIFWVVTPLILTQISTGT